MTRLLTLFSVKTCTSRRIYNLYNNPRLSADIFGNLLSDTLIFDRYISWLPNCIS